MALSLIGETLTFDHDAQLLGFCLSDQNEPEGDDFVTRCEKKNNARIYGHAWFDPEDGFSPLGYFPEPKEIRGVYARFCDMNSSEQAMFMYEVTMHVCELVGVSICDWTPSNEFVLDAIQNELTDDALKVSALDEYFLFLANEPRQIIGDDAIAKDSNDFFPSQQSARVRVTHSYDEEDAKDARSSCRGKWVNTRDRVCNFTKRRASIRRNCSLFFAEEE